MPKAEDMKFTRPETPTRPGQPTKSVKSNLSRMLAWIVVRSACRHVAGMWRQGSPVMVGLVVPADGQAACVSVLEIMLYSQTASSDVLSEATAGKRSVDAQFTIAMRDESMTRVGIVVHAEDAFPTHFGVIADAVVHVPPPTPTQFAAAVWHMTGQRVAEEDAAYLATQDVHLVGAMLRKTSSPAKTVAAMRKLSAAAARPVSGSRPDAPRLEDLHGYGEAQTWGLDLAQDLADWRAGTLPWSDVDRGVLLSGPPGTGKTTFAAALARTCDAHFVAGSYATWQSAGHLGDFQRAIRRAFDEARDKAPTVMLIDEVDSIGSRGSGDKYDRDYTDKVIAAFLEALDGSEGREGVVVVGCANYPDRLDPALRRPGRLDRHIEIPLPDAKARFGILRHHLAGALPGEDLSPVVDITEDWSGAGLEQLVRQARRFARRHRRDLTVGDLLESLPPRVPVPEDVRWRIAVHEAGHAVVGLTEHRGRLLAVEVSRMRTMTAEGPRMRSHAIWEHDDEATITSRREDYLRSIITTLGGIAAERVILGEATDGAGGGEDSDLGKATRLAAAVEGSLGLGGTLTHLATLDFVHLLPGRDYAVRQRVEATLQECLRRAEAIVETRRDDVLAVAREVVERERITGDDVAEIVSRQPRLRLVPGG